MELGFTHSILRLLSAVLLLPSVDLERRRRGRKDRDWGQETLY